jgi:cell division protein FtsI/penicillin-binding protein 2
VTQNPGGTSYGIFPAWMDAAGKSGTAEDLAFGADHVFFAAYARSSAPSVVVLVALEEGKLGSVEAAPKARQVLETALGP